MLIRRNVMIIATLSSVVTNIPAQHTGAELICGSEHNTPKFALCVPGLYNKADSPFAFTSIRTNVIDALGGMTDVFVALFAKSVEEQHVNSVLISTFGVDSLVDVKISVKHVYRSSELERQLVGLQTCYAATLAINRHYTSFIVAPAHLVWTQPLWAHCFQNLKVARIWRYVYWAPWNAEIQALKSLSETMRICTNSSDEAKCVESQMARVTKANLDASLAIAIAPRDSLSCKALRAATPSYATLQPRHRLLQAPCPLIDDKSHANRTLAEPHSPFLCALKMRPHLALLIGGLARSLPHELVYRTIKSNLVDAIGMKTVVFAHIRLHDDSVNPIQPQRLNVDRALDFLGNLKSNRVILDLATTPNNTYCHRETDRRAHVLENQPRRIDVVLQGQLWSRKALLDLMLAHENSAQMRFNSVLFMRPDLTFMVPWLPFCLFDLSVSRIFLDWLWWIPRADAEGALGGPYEDYFVRCVPYVQDTYNASQIPDYSSIHDGNPVAKFMVENWLKYRALVNGAVLYQDPTLATAYITRTDYKSSACGWHNLFNGALSQVMAPRRYNQIPNGNCHAMIDQNPFNKLIQK